MDAQRFLHRIGTVSPDVMDEVVMAIGAVVELP
jgi:mRNA-degrading endonuclease toxin of MazEF toxin-antitoxin module